MKLYQAIAGSISARQNCIDAGNNPKWLDKHDERLGELQEKLPHGSGLNVGVSIDLSKSTKNKLYFFTSYHFMNENGYYDGWEDYKIILTPSLVNNFDLRIVGKNRDYIKEYLYQVFYEVFEEELL